MIDQGDGAHPTADPPTEFDVFELVLLRRPPDAQEIGEEAVAQLQRQHLGHLAAMKAAGHLKVAGPLSEPPDASWRGLCLYQVGSLEEARRLAETDPSVHAGRLSVEVMHWLNPKGTIAFRS
jgi:uncharacterized protein YciI